MRSQGSFRAGKSRALCFQGPRYPGAPSGCTYPVLIILVYLSAMSAQAIDVAWCLVPLGSGFQGMGFASSGRVCRFLSLPRPRNEFIWISNNCGVKCNAMDSQ